MKRISPGFLERCIDQALGRAPADLVIKDTKFYNLVTGEIAAGDIAITGDRIIGTYEGYAGMREIPGVFAKHPDMIAKLEAFQGEQIDGHSPMVSGRELKLNNVL
jgi:adenine deaminase